MNRGTIIAIAAMGAFGLILGGETVRAEGVTPCAVELDRFQAIVTSDHETGNVDPGVFQRIEAELERASAACAAGRSGEAHAIVAASKARHGYRA